MMSMLCNIWDDFSYWVSVVWSPVVFILVICGLSMMALWTLMTFFKKSVNKDKRPLWGKIVLIAILLVIVFVLCLAKFN